MDAQISRLRALSKLRNASRGPPGGRPAPPASAVSRRRALLLLVVVLFAAQVLVLAAAAAPLRNPDVNNNSHQLSPPTTRAYLAVRSPLSGTTVRLLPAGLLDQSLTSRGALQVGQQVSRFHKLKVLGNVYAKRVNGRPLRETYLFRSAIADAETPTSSEPHQRQDQDRKEIALRLLVPVSARAEIAH